MIVIFAPIFDILIEKHDIAFFRIDNNDESTKKISTTLKKQHNDGIMKKLRFYEKITFTK